MSQQIFQKQDKSSEPDISDEVSLNAVRLDEENNFKVAKDIELKSLTIDAKAKSQEF